MLLEVWAEPLREPQQAPQHGAQQAQHGGPHAPAPGPSTEADAAAGEVIGGFAPPTRGDALPVLEVGDVRGQQQQQHPHQQEQRQQEEGPGRPPRQELLQQQQQGGGCLVHFAVRDTGIGIGQEDLGRLFQSFSQVSHPLTRTAGEG